MDYSESSPIILYFLLPCYKKTKSVLSMLKDSNSIKFNSIPIKFYNYTKNLLKLLKQ